jgi:hypothetical protein
MFETLKKLYCGDKRPIIKVVEHPILGALVYSEDDEAWLNSPDHRSLGFNFYIAGNWEPGNETILPDAGLVQHAESIVQNVDEFQRSLVLFLEDQIKSKKSLKPCADEIRQLKLETVCLFWPNRPCDGELYFKINNEKKGRWICAYIGGKPAPHLGFER